VSDRPAGDRKNILAEPETSGFGVKGGETNGLYQSHQIFIKGVIEEHKRKHRTQRQASDVTIDVTKKEKI
jgi:hypothetical protein